MQTGSRARLRVVFSVHARSAEACSGADAGPPERAPVQVPARPTAGWAWASYACRWWCSAGADRSGHLPLPWVQPTHPLAGGVPRHGPMSRAVGHVRTRSTGPWSVQPGTLVTWSSSSQSGNSQPTRWSIRPGRIGGSFCEDPSRLTRCGSGGLDLPILGRLGVRWPSVAAGRASGPAV